MFISLDDMGVSYKKREDVSPTLIAEQVYDELADYIMSLQGWNVLTGFGKLDRAGLDEIREESREHLIKRSRIFARKEPLSKQAIRLYTTYSGILRVEFKSDRPELETVWKEKFWELLNNNFILGPLYRRKLSNRLLSDGELFFTLFVGNDGAVSVRTVDTLEVPTDGLITHPEDKDNIVYYKRVILDDNKKDSGRGIAPSSGDLSKAKYYRNWTITDEALAELESTLDKPLLPEGVEEERTPNGRPILMYHIPFDVFGVRGNGLLFAVVSYVENYRDFLQNRATIVKALATYIRKITVDGGSIAVKDVASSLRSSLSSGNTWYEQNPPDAVGSAWVQNKALDMEPVSTPTQGGEAMSDARIFRQPIASGTGITEPNLTSDPSIGNLASQVQMEGPMLQNFLDYQLIWEVVFKELWQFVLDTNNITYENSDLDVFLPPILKISLPDLITALQFGLDSTTVPFGEAARNLLSALGARDIDSLVLEAENEREEKRATASQISGGAGPDSGDTGDTTNAGDTSEEDAISREIGAYLEHEDVEYEGVCPFCYGDSLRESHGLVVCEDCKATYNPKFHLEAAPEEDVDVLDTSIYKLLIGAGMSKERAIATVEFMATNSETFNGDTAS